MLLVTTRATTKATFCDHQRHHHQRDEDADADHCNEMLMLMPLMLLMLMLRNRKRPATCKAYLQYYKRSTINTIQYGDTAERIAKKKSKRKEIERRE